MKKIKKLFSILGTVLLVFLIAVLVLMFNARLSGEAPSVFGYQVFRVSSGSMEPQLMIGDVILVKSVDPSQVKVGDVVTYKGEVGDFSDKFITHMVVEQPVYDNGEYIFKTRGIIEGALDDPEWYSDQLIGVYVCTVPFINSLYNFFLTPYGLMTFVLVIIVLFGYELISLIVSYKTIDEIEEEVDADSTDNDDSAASAD